MNWEFVMAYEWGKLLWFKAVMVHAGAAGTLIYEWGSCFGFMQGSGYELCREAVMNYAGKLL